MQLRPAEVEPAYLSVRLEAPYRVQTLPDTWDTAVLRVEHPSALVQPFVKTFQKDVDLVLNGGSYRTTEGFKVKLRPASGYTLTLSLWSGGVGGTLVGERQLSLSLAAGVNSIVVPIQVYSSFSLSSFTPSSGVDGDSITLQGQGFSVLPFWDVVSIGGATASVLAAASTSLQVRVPDIAPDSYTWNVEVGLSMAARSGFSMLGTVGSMQTWITNAKHQYNPAVAARPSEYLVVWDCDDLPTRQDIMGVRVDNTGTAIGSPFTVCDRSGDQLDPSITYNPNANNYLVLWEESSNTDLGLCTLSADGATRSTPVVQVLGGNQVDPRAAFNPNLNNYLVVWRNDNDIYGRIFSSDLATSSALIPVIAPGYGDNAATQVNPCVAYSSKANAYLAAWDNDGAGDKQLWARILNADGSYRTDPLVVSANPSDHQVQPAVAVDEEAGDFWVVWVELKNPRRILARRVTGSGNLGNVVVLASAGADKNYPCIAYEGWRKKFAVVWNDKRTGNWEPYGQYLSPNESLWGVNYPVVTRANDQDFCFLAVDETSRRGLVAFQDPANGGDVYGQLIR